MSSPPSNLATSALPAEELARLNAALQAELVAIKAETTAKVASLEDTIANLAHENTLLKRRLYGNRTERGNTSELQLALGELLADETKLQNELDDAVGKVKNAVEPEPEPKPATGPRAVPKGRRDLSLSKLPRVLVEILDDEREAVWAYIENQWPGYRGYERESGRVLRIFRLVPVDTKRPNG